MSRRRFFVSHIRSGEAVLSGDEARHLTRVLRVEMGQKYEISDGASVWLAEVTAARKDRVEFRIVAPMELAPKAVDITLYAALIKFDHFEWMIEKATELGVSRIVPVLAARSEAGLEKAVPRRIERWQRIVLEASQQSRRDQPPVVEMPIDLEEALVQSDAPHRFWLDEDADGHHFWNAIPAERVAGDAVALLIGPEGGWTDRERSSIQWQRVWLGPQVLRAETAALAAIAIIQAAWQAASAGKPTEGSGSGPQEST